jgi:hypothetical protein
VQANDRQYPFDEFLEDFDALRASGALDEGPLERILGAAGPHFKQRYPSQSNAIFRHSLFMMIFMFLAEHFDDFDKGDLAVYGSDRVGGLVSQHLLQAIHQLHAERVPPGRFTAISIAEVCELAESLRSRSEPA